MIENAHRCSQILQDVNSADGYLGLHEKEESPSKDLVACNEGCTENGSPWVKEELRAIKVARKMVVPR